jgi:hypothetical protein
MTAPETLSVDTTRLTAGGQALLRAAGNIPQAPASFALTGADPLSVAAATGSQLAEAPVIAGLPPLKLDATKTASDIIAAACQYARTDEMLAEEYKKHQFDGEGGKSGGLGAPGASGGGGAAGGGVSGQPGAQAAPYAQNAATAPGSPAGQMGQMMGMPMQMAQQAAQIPMQMMGMAAAIPQGIMQGVQSAMQQVGQISGQSDKQGDERPGDDKGDTGTGNPGQEPGPPTDQQKVQPSTESNRDGAGPGQQRSERAPELDGNGQGDAHAPATPAAPEKPPAATRPADANQARNL